jgi:putative heme-binding domain-containing protein
LNFLDTVKDRKLAFALLGAFADGLQRADVPLALFQSRVQPILDHALLAVRDLGAKPGSDPASSASTRVQAIELLGLAASTAETRKTLLSLIESDRSPVVQSAAMGALGRLDDPSIARELLTRWPRLLPIMKRQALQVLLGRPERAAMLVKAVETGTVLRNELTPTQTAFLMAHRTPAVREAAASVFRRADRGDRAAVQQRYLAALDLRGNSARGQTTYRARCASCHEPAANGSPLGPGLETMKGSMKEEILTHVLDPNRTVDARYRLYLIETKDGKSVTGIIQNESPASVTLQPPFGQATTLARSTIARMQGLEQSMMPDGLEEGLSLQDMADLLQFITEYR